MNIPRATARLQLHKGFTFDAAAAVVDYYARLGISHIYASPILTAKAGSTHGYDVTDPTRINPELGGEEGFRRLAARIRQAGMGLILDIVPNHMGIGPENPWWQHVLEWGPASRHAAWFDINWQAPDPSLHGKLLAPFLGQQYGEVLASGEITLQFDSDSGKLFACYYQNRFPLAPQTYAGVLRAAEAPILDPVIAQFDQIAGDPDNAVAHADKAIALLAATAAGGPGRSAIETALSTYSPASEQGREALHQLLERQHYRLAWWRTAAEEINWRRFFEVTELAGVRVELDEVFEATHGLIFRLYSEGLIDGVRLDHIDGLAYPAAYCRKLRQRLQQLDAETGRDDRRPYIIVEKILGAGEQLATDWEVDGTTGYEFMDQASAVLHDPAGEKPLAALWSVLTGDTGDFHCEVRAARYQLLRENFAGEFEALIRTLHAIARASLATRDFSLAAIRRTAMALLLHFPVYRAYVSHNRLSDADRNVFAQAMQGARSELGAADWPLLEMLEGWLTGMRVEAFSTPEIQQLAQRAITQFQQLTPPLAAKSVEDTAFYRYGRLLSRNEVGADPARFALGVGQFHEACRQRAQLFPHSLLATATHDHKRGEDVRMRIAALSEQAIEWDHAVRRWMLLNAPLKTRMGSGDSGLPVCAPYPADEMMLYQMLVGAWPLDMEADDTAAVQAFSERIAQWQVKALRESKRSSSWVLPNQAYETACSDFLSCILDPAHSFLHELEQWIRKTAVRGAVNSLAQLVLRLAAPGIPDLYQGTDFWDFSLVDPDNRRPVDYAVRMQALQAMPDKVASLDGWRSGHLKQQLIRQALAARQRHPELFAHGAYLPLEASGPRSGNVIAFARSRGGQAAIAIVTRLSGRLLANDNLPHVPPAAWQDSLLALPDSFGSVWTDAFTGRKLHADGGSLRIGELLAVLPVALLEAAD